MYAHLTATSGGGLGCVLHDNCMGVARTGGVWSQYLGMAGCDVAGICPTGQINRIGVYKPGGDEKHQLRYPQKLAMLFSRSAVAPLFSRPNNALTAG